jgi:chemotaxis protein methyltransferase CheR
MVTFSVLNLVEDGFPSPLNNTHVMDIILCRNVFIYFSPERIRDVLRRFHLSLVEGGWLIVGPSEAPHLLHSRFTAVNFPGTTLYRKTEPHTSLVGSFQQGVSSSLSDYIPHLSSPLLQVSPLPSLSASVTAEIPPSISPASSPPLSQMGPELRTSHAKAGSLLEEAASLYAQGCYADTIEQLRGLLFTPESLNTHSSLDAQSTALLVRAYANQGQLAEAQEWCQKAVANTPLHPLFHYLLATILLEQDRTEDAWLSLKHTLYLDPDFVLAHFLLGNLAHRQQQRKEAQRHFTNARRLLQQYRAEDIVPESDGLTAGRLLELIATLTRA